MKWSLLVETTVSAHYIDYGDRDCLHCFEVGKCDILKPHPQS